MSAFLDTLCGFWRLGALALRTGLRFNGPYWAWRRYTAFGKGGTSVHAVVEYARWMGRMGR